MRSPPHKLATLIAHGAGRQRHNCLSAIAGDAIARDAIADMVIPGDANRCLGALQDDNACTPNDNLAQ
jgi:hypothetical protein